MMQYSRAIALDYKIDYVSKIAMAIKSLETRAFLQFMDTLSPAAQLAPQVFDNIDFDAAARGLARNLSVPTRWMRPKAEVDADRQARAQAQAQTPFRGNGPARPVWQSAYARAKGIPERAPLAQGGVDCRAAFAGGDGKQVFPGARKARGADAPQSVTPQARGAMGA